MPSGSAFCIVSRKLDYIPGFITLCLWRYRMAEDTDSLLTKKKAQLKYNEILIEKLDEMIEKLRVKKDQENDITAKAKLEKDIESRTAMRESLVGQNKIDAQIVLSLMK
jgi:hypothetical protein